MTKATEGQLALKRLMVERSDSSSCGAGGSVAGVHWAVRAGEWLARAAAAPRVAAVTPAAAAWVQTLRLPRALPAAVPAAHAWLTARTDRAAGCTHRVAASWRSMRQAGGSAGAVGESLSDGGLEGRVDRTVRTGLKLSALVRLKVALLNFGQCNTIRIIGVRD